VKIFIDENIPRMTAQALQDAGHDVKDIRGTTSEGIEDEEIWTMVTQEKRILLTTDKGFSQYRNKNQPGILIILLSKPNRTILHQKAMKGLFQFTEKEWEGKIVVVRDTVQSIWSYENG
jgi:predicted nuclease of predicted toxin-antitoxin system